MSIIVINKPSGLTVHPLLGTNQEHNGLLAHKNLPELMENYDQVVHRLDKDTSGCIVVAKVRGVSKSAT